MTPRDTAMIAVRSASPCGPAPGCTQVPAPDWAQNYIRSYDSGITGTVYRLSTSVIITSGERTDKSEGPNNGQAVSAGRRRCEFCRGPAGRFGRISETAIFFLGFFWGVFFGRYPTVLRSHVIIRRFQSHLAVHFRERNIPFTKEM